MWPPWHVWTLLCYIWRLQKPKCSTEAALSNYCQREIWKRVGCRGFWEGSELTAAELGNIFLCEQQNEVNLIIWWRDLYIYIYTQICCLDLNGKNCYISKYLNIMRWFKDWTVLEQQKYSAGIADGFIKNYMCVYISCVCSTYWFIVNAVITEWNPFE